MKLTLKIKLCQNKKENSKIFLEEFVSKVNTKKYLEELYNRNIFNKKFF